MQNNAQFTAQSRAEQQLVSALNKSRTIPRKIGPGKTVRIQESENEAKSGAASLDGSESESADTRKETSAMPLPRPPVLSSKQEEIQSVRALDIPNYDGTRQFPGLSKQKIVKKDRHIKAVEEFTHFLDTISEGIEQEVLMLSRCMRDDVEKVDESLRDSYSQLRRPDFLIPMSEADLKDMRMGLVETIASRKSILDKYGADLDALESGRADTVSTELKALVDRLIAIGHQLPDEIEHIVETNTFDLNSVLTMNRKAHATLLGMLQKTQVEVDIEMQQRWEDGRSYWRQLRHDKGLSDFDIDIRSDRFERPTDRNVYMEQVRAEQGTRQNDRNAQLRKLSLLESDNISSEKVMVFQDECRNIGDRELDAISSIFSHLSKLRGRLEDAAKQRVEELRKELHVYGALHAEPPLQEVSETLRSALANEELSELWRLGGGLKPEFQSSSAEMCSVDVAYDPHTCTIQSRLKTICCGLNVRACLEERGRLMQLDKVRNLVGKLRGVPKTEVPGVLDGLMPELEDFLGYEQMSEAFHDCIQSCYDEMVADLQRVKETPMVPDTASMASSKSKTSKGSSKSGKTTKIPEVPNCIDPVLVKLWNRNLGILFYACDLPEDVQEACLRGVQLCDQQLECNRLIDAVVLAQSETVLAIMDKKYRKLNDDLVNFLEAQATFMSICLTNIGNFFLVISKMVEAHRKQQKALDEANADHLYDLSEDMRIQKEDAEALFDDACQVLRASTTHDELHMNFEKVLKILEEIQESYRTYHGKACFGADKYPLSLANEFRDFLIGISDKFNMVPMEDHAMLVRYEEIFDETIRFNKKFFEEDINAAGVPPRPQDVQAFMGGGDQADTASVKSGSVSRAGTASGSVAGSKSAAGSRPGSPQGSIVGGMSIANDEEGPGVYESPLIIAAIKAANASKKKKKRDKSGNEEKGGSLEKQTSLPPQPSLSGTFQLVKSIDDTVQSLRVEQDEPEPAEAEEQKADDAVEEDETKDVSPTTMPSLSHPDCQWMRKDADLLPVSEEIEAGFDEYDLYWYENCLAKRFLPLSEEEEAGLDDDDRVIYERTKVVVERARERLAVEDDPVHIRANPPKSIDEEPWVLQFEVDTNVMSELVVGIRDSIVAAIEIEADRRLKRADEMKKDYKEEFTDELEDRLRTHWPRRGRVETGIKQPREAELLGHEEKTWRLIQNVQEKMVNIQRNFEAQCEHGKNRCSEYVSEVKGLEDYITTEKFKNLAKLQGVEVKARGLYIAFQAACVKQINDISRLLDEDVPRVIDNAMDFRKVCPPQEPGVDGGYSPAEILEIEAIMIGQCDDVRAIVQEWRQEVAELDALQVESSKSQAEFTKKYEKVAQDLAMSEGLGQKYGAPRRRAQERIRTEVSRDERSAGLIDETLAKLEFECDEAVRRTTEGPETPDVDPADDEEVVSDPIVDNGYKQMQLNFSVWSSMNSLRDACQTRVAYLQVSETPVESPELPWVPERIPRISLVEEKEEEELGEELVTGEIKASTIDVVMQEIDEACRKETRDLYESEGLGDALGEGGVPEALQVWLAESREKILGESGHREKAWKRLWGQVTRFEKLVGRTVGSADDNEDKADAKESGSKCAISGVCIRALLDASIRFIKFKSEEEEKRFMKLVKVWEQGREKHERLLRPRLGSPDAVDELNELDAMELERSQELKTNVRKFQAELVVMLVDQAKVFCEDLILSYKSLVQYIDTTIILEALQLPPGTAVPKKRMTLKRMRKAQRLRDEVAAGGEDKSKEREWPSLDLLRLSNLAEKYNDLVDGVLAPKEAEPVEEDPKKKGKKGAAPDTEAEPSTKSLLAAEWIDGMQRDSVVRGAVTTAHRIAVAERDDCFVKFIDSFETVLEDIKERYGKLLRQEDSWVQQWANQVDMLRNGKL